jgi:hypothetical protein
MEKTKEVPHMGTAARETASIVGSSKLRRCSYIGTQKNNERGLRIRGVGMGVATPCDQSIGRLGRECSDVSSSRQVLFSNWVLKY